ERAISRNEGTQRTDEKLYQSSHERGNGERSHDTQSIESDSRKIGQSHEQHAINFEHARQDVRRKRREFASDFDKWTRGNGKEQKEKSNNKTVKAVQEMQKSNVEELNQINNEISTSMTNIKRNLNETVKKAEQETRDLVSNAKHGALVTNIIDALKYGAATSAIT